MTPLRLILATAFVLAATSPVAAWWNPDWPLRKKITIDTSDAGAPIAGPIGSVSVLVRLHDGNHQFLAAREDGGDLRFVADDDKTELSYHIEKYDSLLNEAYVWVKLPDLPASAATSFWLYYGNVEAATAEDAKGSYDDATTLVYHFSETSGPPRDASGRGLNAETAGVPVGGALIGGALRLTGQTPITIPTNPALDLAAGAAFTWSSWIKPLALQPNAVLFSRRNGNNALIIGDDNGVPYVEVVQGGTRKRSQAGTAGAVNAWRHLAAVADANKVTLYVDGQTYATLDAGIPALQGGTTQLGKDEGDAPGFAGEIDELHLAKAARSAGWVAFASTNQGSSAAAQKLLIAGEDESSEGGHGGISEHLTLFVNISKSLTFDGWVVIVLCAILASVGWAITIGKLIYLNRIGKATQVFLSLWEKVSTDITALDHADEASVKTLGGAITGRQLKIIRHSPLFHLYHLGSQEIQKRIDAAKPNAFGGLSGRSMQAIRAALDGGQVREVQRLNGKLVFLTIGIAGGPYLGLLGTVIGVMITFAVIAQSGEVDINSIAPGIAGALLATVAGLAVAIPALFAYSYLNSRIKEVVTAMQLFIDEFVTRIAEAYPTANE